MYTLKFREIFLILFLVAWGRKALRRRTTGTGREKYLKDLPRRFKNGIACSIVYFVCGANSEPSGFREGTKAVSLKRAGKKSNKA